MCLSRSALAPHPQLPYLAGYKTITDAPQITYGLRRLDHAVGNVHNLCEAMDYIMKFTGGCKCWLKG